MCGQIPISGFTWSNFHDESAVNFRPCRVPARPADFESPSGSRYWWTDDSVIRQADHWGWARSCFWALAGSSRNRQGCGRARFADFVPCTIGQDRTRARELIGCADRKAAAERRQLQSPEILEIADLGWAIQGSEWVSGSGSRTTRRPLPDFCCEISRKSLKDRASRACWKRGLPARSWKALLDLFHAKPRTVYAIVIEDAVAVRVARRIHGQRAA